MARHATPLDLDEAELATAAQACRAMAHQEGLSSRNQRRLQACPSPPIQVYRELFRIFSVRIELLLYKSLISGGRYWDRTSGPCRVKAGVPHKCARRDFACRFASFSSIAERMNLKYVRSIMRRLVPV
jgi:hypothetical protein